MTERLVPVPVSLIERVLRERHLSSCDWWNAYGTPAHWGACNCWHADLAALLSQPEPSEVEVEGSFFAVADLPDILARHMRALDDAHRREKQHWLEQHEQPLTPEQRRERMCPCTLEPVLPSAESVSIADMAPGMRLALVIPAIEEWAGPVISDRMEPALREAVKTWPIIKAQGYSSAIDEVIELVQIIIDGTYDLDRIDPSTVRDVTPPPTTPDTAGG